MSHSAGGVPMNTYQPHQQRVIAERDELNVRVSALEDFTTSDPIFTTLSNKEAEARRMTNFDYPLSRCA